METVAADEEDDPVISEVDVFLSQSLSGHLHLLQYPLRPAHLPYPSDSVAGVRMRVGQCQVEVDVGITPRGENYSTSRGERYGRMVELSKPADATTTPYYKSGRMDRQMLTSHISRHTSSRYVAGVLKDGELHLTSLASIVQLRPTLSHLDKADAGSKRLPGGGATSEGDTTESEGEEAKPVQVKFSRFRPSGNSSSRKMSFQQVEQQQDEEPWTTLAYHSMDSEEATSERQMLFASEEDQSGTFSLRQEEYLDLVCPPEQPSEDSSLAAHAAEGRSSSGHLSLSQIKTMPFPHQVCEHLLRATMLPFQRLCSLVGGQSQATPLLEAVEGCGVLVQGCWVVGSEALYPGKGGSAQGNVRDYILWCFTQSRVVAGKDITAVTKVSYEDLRDVLRPVASHRAAQGWEFKLPTDHDFLAKYPGIVKQQEEKWTRRYQELVVDLSIPRELVKQPAKQQEHTQVQVVSGAEVVRMAQRRARALAEDDPSSATPTRQSRKLGAVGQTTPTSLPSPSVPPQDSIPMAVGEVTVVSSEDECLSPMGATTPTHPRFTVPVSEATNADRALSFHHPVKQEDPSSEMLHALKAFCREALGRGILGIPELRDKLLLRQTGAGPGDPLRAHGVPDTLLEWALASVGAVEVGQPSGRRLFALETTGDQTDKYRGVLLRLFQHYKCVRRKQLLEEISTRCGEQPDSKTLNTMLRELCHSRGSQWYLLGT